MRTTWTVIVDPELPYVYAWADQDGVITRHGYGPCVADALEDAMGHPMQRWHETMGGDPWYARSEAS